MSRRFSSPRHLLQQLVSPEDAAGLAVFRVLLGAVMAVDAARYLIAGWVRAYYVDPPFLFKYYGFGWVHPLPEPLMTIGFVVLVAAGVAVALGVAYRPAAIVLAAGHAYVFLLDATQYLNHAYLLCLLATLMAVTPAHAALSLDARRGAVTARREVPGWARALLMAQIAIVYVYGAVAKLNPDWLAGVPVHQWLQTSAAAIPVGGGLVSSSWFAGLVVWGGIVFDLTVVPLLLWSRTRWLAAVASVIFHLTNAYIFNIGVFPYAMLAATTLFFAPSWPRRIPRLGRWIGTEVDRGTSTGPMSAAWVRRAAVASAVWLGVQVLVPLRHLLYPGDVAWTEEGHYFAWRMKLRSKSGSVVYRLTDPVTGEAWTEDPVTELTPRQLTKMAPKPDLIVQYAHHLADRHAQQRGHRPEVRADVWVSLNYRRRQRLIDPRVDLAAVQITLFPAPWILPMRPAPPPTI